MGFFNNFRDKTIKEIRLWAWAAAVLPITGLAGLFFVWAFGTERMFGIAMVVGETAMFGTAVFWWWWALHVIKTLVNQWDQTREKVAEVLEEIKEVKVVVKETISSDEDK